MINAPQEHLAAIRQILQKHTAGAPVWAFGSRVTGPVKTYSDMDLVIVGKTPIDAKIMAALKNEFEESNIPFRIDIHDWHKISKEFKEIIQKHHEALC